MVLNDRRGYLLVEIILASAIAFGIAYFIISMTVNLKNKNDDLLVETLVTTDQTIIMNKLMTYMTNEKNTFNCGALNVSGNKVVYSGETIDIVNKYTTVSYQNCSNSGNEININISLTVAQMSNRDFSVKLKYRY